MMIPPVSTSTRPSSVSKALTFANEGRNAVRSATSTSCPVNPTGWCSSMGSRPSHRASASPSTSVPSPAISPPTAVRHEASQTGRVYTPVALLEIQHDLAVGLRAAEQDLALGGRGDRLGRVADSAREQARRALVAGARPARRARRDLRCLGEVEEAREASVPGDLAA